VSKNWKANSMYENMLVHACTASFLLQSTESAPKALNNRALMRHQSDAMSRKRQAHTEHTAMMTARTHLLIMEHRQQVC
jgi:hypothetical protein